MKSTLLAPDERWATMSQVHGTFFQHPAEPWKARHDRAQDSAPVRTFEDRLYPLTHDSPWQTTAQDMTPMSKAVGTGQKAAMSRPPRPSPVRRPSLQDEMAALGDFAQAQHVVGGTSIY